MKIEELLPDSYRKTAELATQFIIENPAFIKLFIAELDKQEPVIAMRLSRVIALCNDQKPELILPYIELLLNLLIRTKNNAIIRNILYVFQKSWKKLNEDDFGKLLDKCFNYMNYLAAELTRYQNKTNC